MSQVNVSVRDDPNFSTRKRSHTLAIPQTSLHPILQFDLKLHAFKIQLVYELEKKYLFLRKFFDDMMFLTFSSRTKSTSS